MVLDLGATENNAALQTDTVADDDIGADGDIGSDSAVLANLGRGVDHDIPTVYKRLSRGSEFLAALLGQRREVQTSTTEEVLGLSNVHPKALEIERVQLVVANHGGEGLLLNRRRSELNAVENRSVEDVKAGVDAVADKLDGLLNESLDAGGTARLVDNNTVLGGLLNLGDNNGTLVSVVLVERKEVLEGVVADDVRVEDEERRIILAKDTLSKLQGPSGVEGFGLDRKLDVDIVLLLVLR